MAECPTKEKSRAMCACTCTTCPNYSTCCDCVRYHRENGGVPACLKK